MREITALSATEMSARLRKKEFSALEATEACLAAIEADGDATGAWLALAEADARAQAKAVDAPRLRGEDLPPLAGVPCGYKDNICVAGLPATCGSKMLAHFVPPTSAAAAEKLAAAGAVTLGKVNMDEFAMGSSGENSAFKPVKNPVDPTRAPGGSSSGSAAAVAAGQAVFTLGSDTGGSVRRPAAFCGVVGLKPTWGSVSRRGVVAFSSSLDQVGPVTRTVADAALVLNAIAGHDPLDATSAARPHPDYTGNLDAGVKGMKIALPREFFGDDIAPDVRAQVLAAARVLEGLGAAVEEVAMPGLAGALPAYAVLSAADVSSSLARLDGVRYGLRAQNAGSVEELYANSRAAGFGPEVKRRVLLGTFALSAGNYDDYYQKAQQVRTLVIRDFERVFEKYDLILSPSSPTVAHKLGEKRSKAEGYHDVLCSAPVNLAGLPAISVPCGLGAWEMPVGMQLIGKAFGEAAMLRAAHAYETERGRR